MGGLFFVIRYGRLLPVTPPGATFHLGEKDIIYNAFGTSLANASKYLGDPLKTEALRESELLVYWDYRPVNLQFHFASNGVSRMAYFVDDEEFRQNIATEIIDRFRGKEKWSSSFAPNQSSSRATLFNKAHQLTLEQTGDSVLLYGYLRH
ncbi:MAG: hypothetical protein AAGB46_06090 [Verrucomicrobiota bacterium]